jgi:hypothetical protein
MEMLWEGTTEVRIDDLFEHSWELDALVFLYRKQFQLHKMSGDDSGEQSYFAQCGEQGAEQEGRSLVHRGCYWVKMFATALASLTYAKPGSPRHSSRRGIMGPGSRSFRNDS